jgi:type II secretory pathway component GspD/PulD (secretin)
VSTKSKLFVVSATAFFVLGLIGQSPAQQPRSTGVQVQLPTTSFFNIRTVVSAPDAGISNLGGVRRSSFRSWSAGIPGLGSLPFPGRGFRNRAVAEIDSASQSGVAVRIISNKELEQDALKWARRTQQQDELLDPNGSRAVQAKADFLSRNIGKRNR